MGMTLDWNYKKHEVNISMLDYVAESLTCFRHNAPKKLQDQSHPHIKPKYCAKAQYVKEEYPPLPPSWEKMKRFHPISHGHFPILRMGSIFHNASSTRIHSNATGKSDQKHHEKD